MSPEWGLIMIRHVKHKIRAGVLIMLSAALVSCSAVKNVPAKQVATSPIVQVEQGELIGIFNGQIEEFRGIPYAAAPIGNYRWSAPQPSESWSGQLDATKFGPSCIQPEIPASSLYYDPPSEMSEDCLTLNVWAKPEGMNAPVIVWIHGGSLRMGGSAQALYDGTEFARRDVVFVSLNYRLGALGWMAHPDLSPESENSVSGNYGLQDQIAALKWVQENIAAFGGDSENVTIMGESAGALSISYLLSSPKAEGLFQKAILQSVNSRSFPELKQSVFGLPSAESVGEDLFKKLGYDSIETARKDSPQNIINKATRARFAPQGVIDGFYLPQQIIDIYDAGRNIEVPILAGFNSGEIRSQRIFLPPQPETEMEYENEITDRYGDLSDEVLAIYPGNELEMSMLSILRDAIYGWATERLVRKTKESGHPAYMYLFDYCYPEAAKADLCAFHASELPFVFGDVKGDRLPPNWPVPNGEGDEQISDAMLDYWTSFAATGNPVSENGPDWLSYGEAENYLHIRQRLEMGTDPISGMFELHEELVQERKNKNVPWFIDVGVIAPPRE